MTFRTAALIHKRRQQQRRRKIPGVSLTAAVIAAAVLLLAMSGASQAEPMSEPTPLSPCGQMGSGEFHIGATRSESLSLSSSDNSCQTTFIVTPPSIQGQVATDCQLSYTSEEIGTSGMEMSFAASGSCDGVSVTTQITVQPSAGASGLVQAQSPTTKLALAKIVAHDVLHLPMFLHYARAIWTYTGDIIVSATPDHYRWPDEYWHWHTGYHGAEMNSGSTRFEVWDDVDWHSDGYPDDEAPDVYATSKTRVIVQANGGYACNFYFKWTQGAGNYPNLHPHKQCYRN